MLSTDARTTRAHPLCAFMRMQWLGYCALVALLIVVYITIAARGVWLGVDYADFRAASLVLMHGGNPYDTAQLWRQENALYNTLPRLHPGDAGYYPLDVYRNPALFAIILIPLARLSFAQGFLIYSVLVVALTIAGVWLTLQALDWTRGRLAPAIAITLVSPRVFLCVWNGQQSTLLLCALGGSLFALRRERPDLAGALMAVGWVKPHLLIPVAIAAPFLLARGGALRWCAGFGLVSALGVVLIVETAGARSLTAWLTSLFGYSGYTNAAGVAHVDAIQSYLPSLSGMVLVLAPHSWNKLVATAVMICGVGAMLWIIVDTRRHGRMPHAGVCALVAVWLLCTPYVHTNDDVLLLPSLALAWGANATLQPRLLPLLALWAFSALSLAFLLPQPASLLGLLPPILILVATARARDAWGSDTVPLRVDGRAMTGGAGVAKR